MFGYFKKILFRITGRTEIEYWKKEAEKWKKAYDKTSMESIQNASKLREKGHMVDGLVRMMDLAEPYFRMYCDNVPAQDDGIQKERDLMAKGLHNVMKEARSEGHG